MIASDIAYLDILMESQRERRFAVYKGRLFAVSTKRRYLRPLPRDVALRNLINIIRTWAERREDRALDWLTALWGYRLQDPALGPARESPSECGKHRILCIPAIPR
jgi:hypothetical protein